MLTEEQKKDILEKRVTTVNHKIHGEGQIVDFRFDNYEKQYKLQVLFVTPDFFEEKTFPVFIYINDDNLCQ